VPCSVEGFFNIQEYRRCGHIIVEVQGYMIREPHTLKCRALTRTKAKLICIQQVVRVKVPLDYFLDDFHE
jgi:hypothetical protein